MARDNEMTLNGNQVKIKIVGKLKPVQAVLEKIEALYPLNIKTDIKDNDADSGCHVFITVPEKGA